MLTQSKVTKAISVIAFSSYYFAENYIYFISDTREPYEAQLGQIWTELFYTCPIHKYLSARANNADAKTFFYWWAATPSCPPESAYSGPTHGTDLWYTFGNTDNFTTTTKSLFPSGYCSFTPVSSLYVFACFPSFNVLWGFFRERKNFLKQ